MISIVEAKKCTGCGACAQKCPKSCISLVYNADGFLIPSIEEDVCIKCDACRRVCPVLNEGKKTIPKKAYSAQISNKDILRTSASGGAFYGLAKQAILKGGAVYGCRWDSEKWNPEIVRAENETELKQLQGSKYLESTTGSSYKFVEKDLKDNKLVLYSGRPCQIAGLKSFLGKEYDNLITVDLVCHGVPSQRLFLSYIKYLEKKKKVQIIEYRFRAHNNNNPDYLCGCYTDEKKRKHSIFWNCDPFYFSFMHELNYRACCYSCRFACTERISDFTLGDFWGIEKILSQKRSGNISLLLANTDNACSFLSSIKGIRLL